jgi:enoyl-CoA hydratase/carnithine racemase
MTSSRRAVSDAEPVILKERRGPVLVIALNRPARLNAWTRAMQEAYFDALEAADDEPEVRAVVLTGTGRGFCVGADMSTLDRVGDDNARKSRAPARPTSLPLGLRKPLIAAINGSCAGIGFVQALYCDVRFVARDAKLATAYARRGLIGEHGISWLLPQVVGRANALDLLISGRAIDGEEAGAIGLANWVCDPEAVLEEAVTYAGQIAELCSPSAIAVIKQQVREHAQVDLADALEQSRSAMLESYSWPDLREGVASFRESRPPRFPPLPPRAAGLRGPGEPSREV